MFSTNPTPQEIFHTRLFEEPLVPIGDDPTQAENTALANALSDYSKRSSSDDFSSLTGFLESHPESPWSIALLTNLGLDYYHTGHYSKTLEVWGQAWKLGPEEAARAQEYPALLTSGSQVRVLLGSPLSTWHPGIRW